jgi:glycosyltransferase involved in cell wall biosynthesis
MNILLISHFFPPDRSTGTEKRTLGYALKLMEMGHNVQVLCAEKWEEGVPYWHGYRDELYLNIPVRRVHLVWVLAPDPNKFLYDNPIVEQHLDQWLNQWQPDIVHITSCLTLSASVIRAVRRRGLPVVLTLTDFWFICPRINLVRGDGSLCDGLTTSWECSRCLLWDTKIYRGLSSVIPEAMTARVIRKITHLPSISGRSGLRGMAIDMEDRKATLKNLIHSVDCLTAPSEFLSKQFKASGVSKPIRVIYSGHDLNWLKAMPPRVSNGLIRFGFIGQLIPAKGAHILIAAFRSVALSSQAKLNIFGDQNRDPVYAAHLVNLCEGQNGAIEFRGGFPPERLGEVLSQIDVLVVPSQWHENNPRVIQESFASKTPVIASNVGGISEFVKHKINGLLFEMDSVEDLVQQMQLVVSDPSIINRLRDGILPTRTMEDEVNEFVRIYKLAIRTTRTVSATDGSGSVESSKR